MPLSICINSQKFWGIIICQPSSYFPFIFFRWMCLWQKWIEVNFARGAATLALAPFFLLGMAQLSLTNLAKSLFRKPSKSTLFRFTWQRLDPSPWPLPPSSRRCTPLGRPKVVQSIQVCSAIGKGSPFRIRRERIRTLDKDPFKQLWKQIVLDPGLSFL